MYRYSQTAYRSAAGVVIEYADLLAGKNLKPLIEQAYGPQGKLSAIKVWAFSL